MASDLDATHRLRRQGQTLMAAGTAAASGAGALALLAATGRVLPAAVWIALATGAALLAQRLLWDRQTEPARRVLDALQRLGRGDLSFELRREKLGPLAPLADHLEALRESQRQLAEGVSGVVGQLQEVPERVFDAMQEVEAGRESTEEAVEETASLMANINSSIRSINSEVESLSRATEEASSSILEMGSSVDEVARSTGSLHDSVDSSTSSIHQISASIRQVAENTDAVQSMAEESAAAMVQMDRAIQEVGQHVAEASELTERVSQGAEEGSRAVNSTIDGIEQIRDQTRDTKAVLERLVARIGEIGEIVNVIRSINDETNLLSLNAAIIAAQAGEQGKAFAVVANHVKTLAQRTGSSTQEIESLIRAVQEESTNAVSAMDSGIESVEQGVSRSRRAGEELEKIRHSAADASQRVSEISRAASEQTRNSKHVAEAAQKTSSMVQQINAAMGEQSRAGDALLKNAESALELCRQVHRSTEEQRESGRFITASISSITDMIRSIQTNTESHGQASESVSEAVNRILQNARKTGERIPEVVASLESLRSEARKLAAVTRSGGADDAAGPAGG